MAGEWRFVRLQSCTNPKSAVNVCPVGRLTAEIRTDSLALAQPLCLKSNIIIPVAPAYSPIDYAFCPFLCCVCTAACIMLRGFGRHVRSECHCDYYLHGVFTAFAAYFREMRHHHQSCMQRRGRDECLFPLLEVPGSKRWPAIHRPT